MINIARVHPLETTGISSESTTISAPTSNTTNTTSNTITTTITYVIAAVITDSVIHKASCIVY